MLREEWEEIQASQPPVGHIRRTPDGRTWCKTRMFDDWYGAIVEAVAIKRIDGDLAHDPTWGVRAMAAMGYEVREGRPSP